MYSVDVATSADVARRHSSVAAAEAKCQQLSAELRELDRKRTDVQQRFEALQGEIEGHKIALAAHIHSRILAEIFSEIFQYCCGTDELKVFNREGPQQLQWILSAVCQRWRAMAHSTPQLWSSLHFDVTYAIRHHIHDMAGIAKQILKRSGQVPLTITLGMAAHRHHFLCALLKESIRWKSFRLSLWPHKSNSKTVAMLNDECGNFPILEAIDIPCSFPAPLNAFKMCPKLHTLILSGTCSTRDVSLPWAQITSFTGLLSHPNDAFKLFESMPAVQHTDMRVISYMPMTYTPPKDAIFSDTRSLYLSGPCHFVQSAVLPALAELSISMAGYGCVGERYTSLFSRVVGSLTTLELSSVSMAPETMTSILQHLTRLERLEIFQHSVDSSIYEAMIATGSCILPNLRILYLGFAIAMTSTLLTMLETRVRAIKAGDRSKDRGTPLLESVFIGYLNLNVTDDLHDRMLALQGNGMHVEFRSSDDPTRYDSLLNRLSTRRKKSELYRRWR
ncbi:hypothetical protein HGRIS_000196 [Hohenbuehelia grisea]|uniref:F-box domain-containing protein n=1 Tax=Hohenbuehelia grisea TaxID=104357 RepID=A0ABR3JQH7_9AGAR